MEEKLWFANQDPAFVVRFIMLIRGNRKGKISFKDEHFEVFCNHLNNVVLKYHCKIHLFCLMTNHVHLVVEVGSIPLHKIMQNINSIYARKLNDESIKLMQALKFEFLKRKSEMLSRREGWFDTA